MMKNKTDNKPQTQSKGKKIVKTILNTIINILIIIILLTSLVVAVLALSSKASGGVPSIFGYSFHTIQTPSMQGGSEEYEGGNYDPGDLVIGKVTKNDPNEVYDVGDIVVYTTKDDSTPDGVGMIVHRIVEVDTDESGTRTYITRGDNNDTNDPEPHTAAYIVAVCYDHDYHGAVIKGVGGAMDYIRTPSGFFLVVLLPMIIFFLYEIIRVVVNAMDYKKSKAKESKEEAEREKQEAVDAAVKAALEAQQGNQNNAAVSPAEGSAPPEMSQEELEEFRKFQEFQRRQKELEEKGE